MDRNGKYYVLEGTDLLAIAICHETDHLDGVLYTDKALRMLTKEEIEATKAKLRVNLSDSNDLEELATLNAERDKIFEYLLAHNTIVEEEPEKSVKEKEVKTKKVEKKEEEKKADKKEPKKTTKKN